MLQAVVDCWLAAKHLAIASSPMYHQSPDTSSCSATHDFGVYCPVKKHRVVKAEPSLQVCSYWLPAGLAVHENAV